MDQAEEFISQGSFEGMIVDFVEGSSGLSLRTNEGHLEISQTTDGKALSFAVTRVEEVISRLDSEGRDFLQVNFNDGKKILLTEKLIGFKPADCTGLDLKKLPKVVTTPDLVSVVEAIEESMNSEKAAPEELEVLRRVFDSVIEGGEAVGFDLSGERQWLSCIATIRHKPSA